MVINSEHIKKLDRMAKRDKISRSSLIRLAIKEFLKENAKSN